MVLVPNPFNALLPALHQLDAPMLDVPKPTERPAWPDRPHQGQTPGRCEDSSAAGAGLLSVR